MKLRNPSWKGAGGGDDDINYGDPFDMDDWDEEGMDENPIE